MRPLFSLLLLAVWPSAAQSQDADPFGATDDNTATEAEWTPTHPDGDTPHERMLSLAHTDALPQFDRVELYAVSMPKRDPFSDEKPKPNNNRQDVSGSSLRRPSGDPRSCLIDWCQLRQTAASLAIARLRSTWGCVLPLPCIRDSHVSRRCPIVRNDSLLAVPELLRSTRYDAEKQRYTHGWYGFANDNNAKALLKLFRSLLPHPKL